MRKVAVLHVFSSKKSFSVLRHAKAGRVGRLQSAIQTRPLLLICATDGGQENRQGDKKSSSFSAGPPSLGKTRPSPCRPCSQRQVRHSLQLRRTGSAGGLNCHPVQDGHQVLCQCIGIGIGGQITFFFCALETAAYRHLIGVPTRDQLGSDRICSLSARERALDQETSARVSTAAHRRSSCAQQSFRKSSCRRGSQGLLQTTPRFGDIAIQDLAEQGMLVAKSRIKARPVDSHRRRQIGQRRSFVTFFPEHLECAIQGRLSIK